MAMKRKSKQFKKRWAASSWEVVVMDLGGGTLLHTVVRGTMTVAEVKQLVAQNKGIPAANQQFVVATRAGKVGGSVAIDTLAAEAELQRGETL